MFDTSAFAWTVITVKPNHVFGVKGLGTFILEPIDAQTTRLIYRQHALSAAAASEPFSIIMGRRMLVGIQERAEGRVVAPVWDIAEVLTWMAAFTAAVVAGVCVLVQQQWAVPFAVLLGAIVSLLVLLFARPSLDVGVLLDVGLLVALVWIRRTFSPGSTTADRPFDR